MAGETTVPAIAADGLHLPAPVIVLAACLAIAFAVICGLGAVVLAQRKGLGGTAAVLAGFAAASAGMVVAGVFVGMIADMA